MNIIDTIPIGSTRYMYNNTPYIVSKELHSEGKSVKVFAEDLNGNDFISFNLYKVGKGPILKPCEMSDEKVVSFLKHMKL